MPAPLPVDDAIPDLLQALGNRGSAVLVAPPGAGKTTRVPPAIDGAGLGRGIAVLQPRRVAARATAGRIASEQGWRIGEEIGWQIRHENRTGPNTRIRVMTEGILTRRLLSDPFLEGIGCVVLDEFHERSIHCDLALAFLREIQTTVRPELKIVVMSATMDPKPVAAFLGGAPIIESRGRMHEVDVRFASREDRSGRIEDDVAVAVRRTLMRDFGETGHVLVFLPGMREILRVRERLDTGDAVCVLHGGISPAEQDAAIAPSDRRKIILSTNIAETSLTIDGVRTVIDSGFARIAGFDAGTGIDRLETKRISRASADQRAGRAGRTAPGVCLRLWTKAEDTMLAEETPPEVRRTDIASAVLSVKSWGTRDAKAFRWYEKPSDAAIDSAERLLRMLGVSGGDGGLTERGRQVAALPLHPRLGALLVEGERRKLGRQAAGIAALASEDELSPRHGAPQSSGDSDVLARLESLDRGSLPGVTRVRDELAKYVRSAASASPASDEKLLRLLLHGWPDRVTRRREPGSDRGVMVGGRGVRLDKTSCVRRSELFLSVCIRDTHDSESVVTAASRVESAWIREEYPDQYETEFAHRYDTARECVVTSKRTTYQGLVLDEREAGPQSDPEGASAMLAAALSARAEELFVGDEASTAFLARLAFLRRVMPECGLPTPDLAHVVGQACSGRFSLQAVREGGLANLLRGELTWKQRQLLDAEAPERVPLPSGRSAAVEYPNSGDGAPVMAARLQEMFGMMDAPTLAGGRAKVVVHLLGPNYRPVQITQDLRGFWERTYQEVRRELRARYPKHSWPEDPMTAKAVAGVPRKR